MVSCKMRVLATLHRWWGIVFCLLFAMWFASAIVMHFVTFPSRSKAGHISGSDFGASAGVRSEQDALHIAADLARSRGLDPSHTTAALIEYDQWTVAGEFDSDRPLYRVAVNDDAGTEIYVSQATGDVVLLTTRTMRLANYFGSIAHWIYPAALRHHGKAWRALMWWLTLLATIGAGIGAIVGMVQLGSGTPYRGLQRAHHLFGLILSPFILCWIFSGFLSMDDGLLSYLSAKPDSLFRALHTFDVPTLASHPLLRSSLIVGLCLCGFVFSLTGVTLAWRRLSGSHPAD
jgi:hypothetical protein